MTGPFEAVAEVRVQVAAAQAAERASEHQEHDLRAQAKAQEAKAQAQVEARAAQDARIVRAGQTPSEGALPGLKAARLAQASADAADALLGERGALQAATRAAQATLTDAALTLTREQRDAAQRAAQEALRAALAEPLARLIAAEVVRSALIGDRFAFNAEAHPPASLWSGAHVAREFLANLPGRLTPPGFAAEVEESAAALARETLARIGMNHV